ncbi:MAG: DUF4097 family beta strand repeat-containing protein [Acidobacteriota bacterium]
MRTRTLFIAILTLFTLNIVGIAQQNSGQAVIRERSVNQTRVEREDLRQGREEQRERRRNLEVWSDDREPMQEAEVVKLKVERGGKVVIENFHGDVTVNGADGEMLEAKGEGDDDKVMLGYRVSGSTVFIKRSLLKGQHRGGETNIQVSLPRYAGVQVSVITGTATISKIDGEIKANVVSGDLVLNCVKGQVKANSVSGSVEINGATGNVDAEAVSGDVTLKTEIRLSGVYNLKSMSGDVAMMMPEKSAGFTATLTTFNGDLETDFPLKLESTTQTSGMNRRIVGKYGDGQARVVLNSFNGTASIKKATGAFDNCK